MPRSRQMDVDKDQKLTKVEILDMLKTFNMDPADMKEVIDELMAKFDTDGDGGVSYNEFAEFVKPKNVVDLTNVADHNNRGVGYFDAEHAAKIKKAAPSKPVKEATAAELEGYRAKLAEKIGTKSTKSLNTYPITLHSVNGGKKFRILILTTQSNCCRVSSTCSPKHILCNNNNNRSTSTLDSRSRQFKSFLRLSEHHTI